MSTNETTKKKTESLCAKCFTKPCLPGWTLCEQCWETRFKWPGRTKKKTESLCAKCFTKPCLPGWTLCEQCWETRFKWPGRPGAAK